MNEGHRLTLVGLHHAPGHCTPGPYNSQSIDFGVAMILVLEWVTQDASV